MLFVKMRFNFQAMRGQKLKMGKKMLLLALLGCFLITQGCLAAAVGYGAYTYGSSKDEATQKEAETKNIQTYNTYKTDADKLNLEREKARLKPQPVMTFAEWKLAHNIATPVPEPKAASSEPKKD
jgi:hypothetical protein